MCKNRPIGLRWLVVVPVVERTDEHLPDIPVGRGMIHDIPIVDLSANSGL